MAEFTLESLPAAPALTPAVPSSGFVLESMPGGDEQPSTVMDMLKSAGSGAMRGAAALPGMAVDTANAGAAGVDWIAEKIARKIFGDETVDAEKARRIEAPSETEKFSNWVRGVATEYASGKAFSDLARKYLPGADYEPQTRGGRYARTVGEFAPMAATGPGGPVRNLLQYGVGAGIASEAAGEAAEGTKYEPYARAAGAIAGGGVPSLVRSMLPGSRTAEAAIARGMRGVTADQVNAAEQLMTNAQRSGVTLTWPEALAQVTNQQRTAMTTLQRNAESDLSGRGLLSAMMGNRPQQVEQSVQGFLGELAPAPANVSQVGPMLARNAERHIEGVRRDINQETRPLYDAARVDRVDAPTMATLTQLPGWEDALHQVRNDAQLNRRIAGLPDNNVLVVDAVKQRLNEAVENAAQPLNPQASQTRAAGMRQDARDLQAAATNASPSLDTALREQARLRAERSTPLQEGQMGDIARSGDTRGAVEALLPSAPLPGSAAETGRTTATLAAQDAQLTAQAIRTRLEDQFNKSAKDLQAGENQYGGANFRKNAYGNTALRDNLRAAVHELPNGQQLGQGLDNLMEVLQATGRREQPGSMTAFNEAVKSELKQGSAAGELLVGATKANPLKFLRDRYETWTLGRNMEDIARIISDPDSRDLLVRLAGEPRRGGGTARIQAAIAVRLLAPQPDDEKRRRLTDSMLNKQESRR